MLSFLTTYRNPFLVPSDLFGQRKNKFSSYLPYAAYDPKSGLYWNKDDTNGFIFKCSPRIAENRELEKNIASLLGILSDIPGSVMSFSMLSSPNIKPHLERYKRLKKRSFSNPLLKSAIDKYVDFLERGTDGLPQLLNIPVRNLEVYVSFKAPVHARESESMAEIKATVFESLKGSYMNPVNVTPDELIPTLFMLLNGRIEFVPWDPRSLISDQVILADTTIRIKGNVLQAGPNHFSCITPKHVPPEVSLTKMGKLIGEDRGPIDDSNQVPCHFMFTTVYSYDSKIANLIRSKAAFFKRQTEGEDSILIKTIGRYAEEHLKAVDELEKGKKYIYAMPMIWLWADSREKLKVGVERTKRLMSRQGFVPQVEDTLISPLFLASLPFGLYPHKGNMQQLDRYFLATEEEAACLAPVIGDYQGGGEPQMFFISRKGQLISFDPFDKTARNKNICVMGTTGGGKSFALNLLVLSMFASNSIVRIFDLGYSYRKLCRLMKGDYIDPSERRISLNPFSFIPDDCDERELKFHLDNIAALYGIAAYADTDQEPSQDQKNLLRGAVQYAWELAGKEAELYLAYEYLAHFPKLTGPELAELCKNKSSRCRTNLAKDAHLLAFNLTNWLENGTYGEWFNGKANVDLVSSPFIVFELEHLRRNPALLKVISLAVVNATTAVMYLLPRDIWKMVIFEECGIVLKGSDLFKTVVEEAYRRGRKNNVSTTTVFQSPLDLQKLGQVGDVILSNADYHLYLPSPDYSRAIKEKVLPLEGCEAILNSINSAKPRYSEIGIRTPYGLGVGRVVVDHFMYWLATSDPTDWTTIQNEVKSLEEKRRDKRLEIAMDALVVQLNRKAKVINLSKKGCLLNVNGETLPKGTISDLEILADAPIRVRADVVHARDDLMGLKFVHFYEGEDLLGKILAENMAKEDESISNGELTLTIERLEKKREKGFDDILAGLL